MIVDLIAGTRPNFVKIASIVRALERNANSNIEYRLVHTGQHYDNSLSGSFFNQLNIPAPFVNLETGSGSQAVQTAAIMTGYEAHLEQHPTNLCLVVGDVNSTMACAITARKLNVEVAHVEAGIRSRDWSMPEEINRVVTDSISNWFYTTTPAAGENLVSEGVSRSKIIFVGNTMIDTLLHFQDHFLKPSVSQLEDLRSEEYLVLTMHRPSNVDNREKLQALLSAVINGANGLPVIFPAHPRTQQVLSTFDITNKLLVIEALSYLEFNYLIKNAKGVITDSGGITEETTVLGVPCMTIRENTERPETVDIGTNILAGTNPDKVTDYVREMSSGTWKEGAIPDKWDGRAGDRIVDHLNQLASS
jgi:UDP-N-acetylglucosamine 2-epimerase (non-hydrolysing)